MVVKAQNMRNLGHVQATTPAPAATPAQEATPEAKAEAVAASNLEKKFQEAARSYRKVEKNGETMYCKKEKPINSTIPRMIWPTRRTCG